MRYDLLPLPLADGALEPPRRNPPTALGTAERPPLDPPPTRYPAGPSLIRRIALRGLALIFLLGSVGVLWPLTWQSSVGLGLMGLSVHVAHRSLVPKPAVEVREAPRRVA
jgi:hypothetical protein